MDQVGISIALLSDSKMLNSIAGQTTLTAAFVDDVFSLILLVLLTNIAAGPVDAGMIIGARARVSLFPRLLARVPAPVCLPWQGS